MSLSDIGRIEPPECPVDHFIWDYDMVNMVHPPDFETTSCLGEDRNFLMINLQEPPFYFQPVYVFHLEDVITPTLTMTEWHNYLELMPDSGDDQSSEESQDDDESSPESQDDDESSPESQDDDESSLESQI